MVSGAGNTFCVRRAVHAEQLASVLYDQSQYRGESTLTSPAMITYTNAARRRSLGAISNKMPRYRRDNRAMRPISALKIVCKRKISRRLRENRHITILSLFGGEIIFEVFPSNVIRVAKRYRRTDRRTIYCGITRQTKCRRYYRYRRYLKMDMDHHYMQAIRALQDLQVHAGIVSQIEIETHKERADVS